MAKRWRRKIVLAHLEDANEKPGGAPGTGVLAMTAADAVLVGTDVELTPVAGDTVDRELLRPNFGNSQEYNVNVHQTLAFSVDLAAKAGFAFPVAMGDAPPWGILMRACGMAEVTTNGAKATGSIAYSPTNGDSNRVTLAVQMDGVQHRLAHALGTWTLEFAANAVPRLRYTFTGLYADPTDTPLVNNPSVAAWGDPVLPSDDNTPTFSLHGAGDLALQSLSLDYGNEVQYLEAIGAGGEIAITDRKPSGSLTIRAPSVADFAAVKKAKESAAGALSVVHGPAAGAQIKIDCPKLSLSSPTYSEDRGLAMLQANVRPLPSAGSDEIKISIA